MTCQQQPPKIIPPHGGYRDLQSYQMSEFVYDATVVLCDRFTSKRFHIHDQMVQAARSGKHNHACGVTERCMASGTSRKTELKVVVVARASLEELLLDFEDYRRQHNLSLWGKDHPEAKKTRGLCYRKNRSYLTYRPYIEKNPTETAAKTLVSLVHQTNYLLEQQLWALEKEFLREGGFTERRYHARTRMRNQRRRP